MIQKLDQYIEFDERVEKFLKNQMTSEEEMLFKSELKNDPGKMARAKTIVLAIKEMSSIQQAEDAEVVSAIERSSKEEYKNIIESVSLSDFDDEVTRFLKKQMTVEEETAFKAKLKQNKTLEKRAKTIALTIKEMRAVKMEQESKVIEQISIMNEVQFRRVAGIPAKVVTFSTFIKHHAAAACIAALIICCGGGVGAIQWVAYNETTSIGERYYSEAPNSISYYRGEIDKALIDELEQLFANVKNADNLDACIEKLSHAYDLSSDESNEFNYIRNDIAWNLAMAQLKVGNRKAAKPILEQIVNDTELGRPLHDIAQKALDDINDIISLW